MTETDKATAELERLFAAARQDGAQMPDDLARRILADAMQVQDGFSAAVDLSADGRRAANGGPVAGRWRQLLGVLGGWPTVGGLATACAAGIWIGVAPPSFLPDPAQLVVDTQSDISLFDGTQLALALAEEQ